MYFHRKVKTFYNVFHTCAGFTFVHNQKHSVMADASFYWFQIKSNLFAISAVHNITIHEFALHLAGQTGDNFALISAHDN